MTESTTAPTDTHRRVVLRTLEDVLEELDRLEAADAAGELVAGGTWTPGQIGRHLAIFMRQTIDGFSFRPPFPIRVVGRFMKGWALGPKPMPKGLKLRGDMKVLVPDPVDTRGGFDELRTEIRRVTEGGATFSHPSPLFGPLSHEEWIIIQLKHAAHHLGFLSIAPAG